MIARRRFITRAVAGAAAIGAGACTATAPRFGSRDPYTLGVASGYPRADGVVLWTRLAPEPLAGGGMGAAPVEVRWEVAHDDAFTRIAASGVTRALAEDAHAVHVEVDGLQAERPYWYRFIAGDARSPVGRTRTPPAHDAQREVRLAFGSCQQYEQGYYAAHRDLARQAAGSAGTRAIDLMVHLGDYIYESSWGSRLVRRHEAGVPATLEAFRNRYARYKSDADLQAAHAALPWLVIWDDHEVANDYTGDVSPAEPDPARFLALRAAAYRAWWEHMPVPLAMRPRGPHARIHAHHRHGGLLDVMLLDGRQHRSHHACLPGRRASARVDCAARLDPARSYLGPEQEAWLGAQLARPPARWTVLAQPTLMAEARLPGAEGAGGSSYWMDGWDGYAAARERLLGTLAAVRPRNVLVASGDVHAFWAADLARAHEGTPVATEFVGGAITSQGPGPQAVARLRAANPHLRWGRADRRGYAVMSLGADGCDVEFRAVDDEKRADSDVRTLARFRVADGRAGVSGA